MKNLMIVKVKYGYSYSTLSTERFSYALYDGTELRDRVRLSYPGYGNKLEQAVEWLKKHGHKVIGSDGWGRNEGYVVIESVEHSFKSLSGKHEEHIAEVIS